MEKYLSIRLAREGDIKQLMLFEFRNRGWFSRFLPYLPHRQKIDLFIKQSLTRPLATQHYLVFLSNAVLIGRFSVQFLDNLQETVEITYKVSKAFCNKGIAKHALKHLLIVWASQGVKKVYAHISDHNIASKRVLVACGFTLHERQSHAMNLNNQVHDCLVYQWSENGELGCQVLLTVKGSN